MNVSIIGAGYVGLVTAACLAQAGHRVVCIEKDAARLALLDQGRPPIHEPGLEELLAQTRLAGRLSFTAHMEPGVREAEVVFIAVGTPAAADGRADLRGVLHCAGELAACLRREATVALKSTVPVGTCERVQGIFDAAPAPAGGRISVASNPEFLAEGRAIADFCHPDRIVIGTADAAAERRLRALYAPFDPRGERIMHMSARSAELAKYASNAMLAARVSMVNELARIAARLDADIEPVCRAMGADPRIGPRYLSAGAGFGGSCLPKDILALIGMAADHGEPAELLRSVHRVNDAQIAHIFQMIAGHFGGRLENRVIAVWGLAFKAGTDDTRAAPSLALIRALLQAGARVQAYDPVASCGGLLDGLAGLDTAADAWTALERADALAVMTEWPEFRHADPLRLAALPRLQAVFDARNLYDPQTMRSHGLAYYGIGRGRPMPPAHTGRGRAHAAGHGDCLYGGPDTGAGMGQRPAPAFRTSSGDLV